MTSTDYILGGFIITYNRPEILRQTILKVLAQSRPPDILVIAVNGNAAKTEEVLTQLGDSRIRHYPLRENRGPARGASRAIGRLLEYRCDYIYWGDDGNPPPEHNIFEQLITILREHSEIGGTGTAGTLWDWQRGKSKRIPDSEL